MPKKHKVCIIGAEGWGSAISTAVCENVLINDFDPRVHIYVYDELVRSSYLSEVMNERHENIKYLPGVELSKNLIAVNDLIDAAENADILIFATPQDFVKSYCNILSGRIKSTAYAVSLIKGLDHIKDGEIDLYSHFIAKQLQIPCYTVMNANSAMEMAQGKLCEITIGCNNTAHVNQLTKLFQTENCKVFSIDDVDGVELCNTLKDLVAISAGFVDGLRLGENARVACLHLGLKEMMRFIKSFNPSTKLSTFFESCGIANSVVSSYADKNVTFAKSFVTSRKTVQEIEANLLNGRKLLGPILAEEIYGYLKKNNLIEKYPIFAVIHRICQNEVTPDAIIETLRNHPDLRNYSFTELQKDEFLLSSLDEKVTENVADTVPEPSPSLMEKAFFDNLDEKTLQTIKEQNEGFWQPYHQYFTVPDNVVELRQFLKGCQKSCNLNVIGTLNESRNENAELSMEIGLPEDQLEYVPILPNIESKEKGESPGNKINVDKTGMHKELDTRDLTTDIVPFNELKSSKGRSIVITAKPKANNELPAQDLNSLVDKHVKPFNQKYEALMVRVKAKRSEEPKKERRSKSKLETSTKIHPDNKLGKKTEQKQENPKALSNDNSFLAKMGSKKAKGEQAKAEIRSKHDEFDNGSMFSRRQTDKSVGVSQLLELVQAKEIDAIEQKVIGNSFRTDERNDNREFLSKSDFNQDFQLSEVPVNELTFQYDEITSQASSKQYLNNDNSYSSSDKEFRRDGREIVDKEQQYQIEPIAKEFSKSLDGSENLEGDHKILLFSKGEGNNEGVPKFRDQKPEKIAPSFHNMDWEQHAYKLRADDFEDHRFLPIDKRDNKNMNHGKKSQEHEQIIEGDDDKIQSERTNSPTNSIMSNSENEVAVKNNDINLGNQPETSKLEQEHTEQDHTAISASNEQEGRSKKCHNYNLNGDEQNDMFMPKMRSDSDKNPQELSLPDKFEKPKLEIKEFEKDIQDIDEQIEKSKLVELNNENNLNKLNETLEELLFDDEPSTTLEAKVAQYDKNMKDRRERMAEMNQEITKDNEQQITEYKEDPSYFHKKNDYSPEWKWLLDEFKDEDEDENVVEKDRCCTRELKVKANDSLEEGKVQLNRKETAADSTKQTVDDEFTKSTRKVRAPKDQVADQDFNDESTESAYKAYSPKANKLESSKSAKFIPEEVSYEENTPDDKASHSAHKHKNQESHKSTKFLRPEDDHKKEYHKAYIPEINDEESMKSFPKDEISHEEKTFNYPNLQPARKEYAADVNDHKTHRSKDFIPKIEASYEDDDETPRKTYSTKVKNKETAADEYIKHRELFLDVDELDKYNLTQHMPQDKYSNGEVWKVESSKPSRRNEMWDFMPETEHSYEDRLKYFMPLAKGQSKKKKHSKALRQHERRFNLTENMEEYAKEEKPKLETRTLSKLNKYKKFKRNKYNKSEQAETPNNAIKSNVSQMSFTKKLANIMSTGELPNEESPKEQKVEYSGRNPYLEDIQILPMIKRKREEGKLDEYEKVIKIKSKSKHIYDSKHNIVINPSYQPPLNPRVRVPRPPFDVRDHEYHTVNYRPPPDLLLHKSAMPQCRMSTTYQIKTTATKNMPKLPRPALKLPTSFMHSSLLAVELGLFAALLTRYKGSCK